MSDISELEEVEVTAERVTVPGDQLQYPYDQDRLPGIAVFRTVDKKDNPLFTEGGPVITLPLPAELSYADQATYENANLGPIGSALADGTFTEKAKSIGDNLNAESAADAMTDLLSKVTGNRTSAISGKTPNPNTRALFKQVSLRSFQFAYTFTPTSPEEAETVKKIIKAFRKELYPNSTNTSGEGFEIAYRFPNRFDIQFFLGNEEDGQYLIKPKLNYSFLSGLTTSYNTKSILASQKGGGSLDFAETTLSLTFMESKTLFSKDVDEGY